MYGSTIPCIPDEEEAFVEDLHSALMASQEWVGAGSPGGAAAAGARASPAPRGDVEDNTQDGHEDGSVDRLPDTLHSELKLSWAAMQLRISQQVDPAVGVREELLAQAQACWLSSTSHPVPPSPEALGDAIRRLPPQLRDRFHHEWCRTCYDSVQVLKTFDLDRKPCDTTLREWMKKHTEEFYDSLLDTSQPCEPIIKQRRTPLSAVTPAAVAKACARVSVGQGLPGDGHCVHAAFLGQTVYYMNVAGTKLPLILEGDSAAGKDNLKDLILGWIGAMESEGLPATTTMKSSKITTAGVLQVLQETIEQHGSAQVQILNGELEKVVNKKREAYLQEADLIELLDGSDAFGCGTGRKRLCVRPNVWMFMGTQLSTYLREFGTASKGRLRLVIQD